MSTSPEMKTFEIVYVVPDNLVTDTDPGKSLSFHRFMRHSRECHKNLLEFLIQNSLLSEVGGSTHIANERKTLLECSEAVAAKVRGLPFVEKTEERPDIVPHVREQRRQRPPATGRG